MLKTPLLWLSAIVAALFLNPSSAFADPCGMVPPISVGDNVPIARVGYQQTYVFFKDGLETFVIHPGFKGKVDEFGMLIPFPAVPSLRKVSDHTFDHLAKAVDPPEVLVDLRFGPLRGGKANFNGRGFRRELSFSKRKSDKKEVEVIKQEAVGMYEVTVLEAGSAAALKLWMDDHGYRYPTGMDAACEDYVAAGWCFVAVKTKVNQKEGVDPQPGQRTLNPKLPDGSSFDGHVQAMGFRFKTEKLVVPMRLSTFNAGDLHNIVYVLSDEPLKLKSIPEEYVVRQVPGSDLHRNVTGPLPLRVIGGTVQQIPMWQKKNLTQQRNPQPHNGVAKDLFASDLFALQQDQLSHDYEEDEKMLLMIGERLGLRGTDIDTLNENSLKVAREKTINGALGSLKEDLTLTVIDGNFPREVLANQNLAFTPYKMPARRNKAEFYNAVNKGPSGKQEGIVTFGVISAFEAPAKTQAENNVSATRPQTWWVSLFSCLLVGLLIRKRRKTVVT